ncbi:MAG: malto-oligosyltrehalose synthase [Deltaproteobacteria bacterium]
MPVRSKERQKKRTADYDYEHEHEHDKADKMESMNTPSFSHIPRCTYRLQLRRGFGFAEMAALAGYLADLGISHCYTSPFFTARPGSSHGYDVVDPNQFNPEIGNETAFRDLVGKLTDRGLSLLVDVVPNHMAIMGSDNSWWLDVLENGPASIYAPFFDIDWQPLKRSLRNRLLVPVLGDQYGRELEAGRIRLIFDEREGGLAIIYFDHLFPLDPRTYPLVLRRNLADFAYQLGEDHADLLELREILELCAKLSGRRAVSASKKQQRRMGGRDIRQRLAALRESSAAFRAYMEENIRQLNGRPGEGQSFAALHHLLERQVFRLSFWKVAAEEVNYRRFFDINDLAGLRMEQQDVFERTHLLLFRLVESGGIGGLRIDHVDGLYDPAGYLRRLRRRLESLQPDRKLYLAVEKILADREPLTGEWGVDGTTGYDFAAQVIGLLVDDGAVRELDRTYRRVTGVHEDFSLILRASKKRILARSMAGELNMLATRLDRLSEKNWRSRDFTLNALRQALVELISSFPVYRTYVAGRLVSDFDQLVIHTAVRSAKLRNPGTDHTIFDFIASLLLQRPDPSLSRSDRKAVLDFTMRFQQLTAPVTAKGMEDTSFDRFNRLVALNEVGGDPGRFGIPVSAFHKAAGARRENWPHAMLATSTHDSKRSEDVRTRLAVLSEATADWRRAVGRWRRMNSRWKRLIEGRPVPDANDEYFLYQNLFGFWPLTEPDSDGWHLLQDRLATFMLKAVREAKLNTSWRNPDESYEGPLCSFIEGVFANRGSAFWDDFLVLHRRLAPFGLYNSLSQTLLKFTVPGVPDIYQGCELWNFSLVDPDNRRPVDFAGRGRLLQNLKAFSSGDAGIQEEVGGMFSDMIDGRIKMYITLRCLALRRRFPSLFAEGDYQPLAVEGRRSAHLCAFLRQRRDQVILVLAPRLFYRLTGGDPMMQPLGKLWEDTAVSLPDAFAASTFVSQFTGEELVSEKIGGRQFLPVGRLLRMLPISLSLQG